MRGASHLWPITQDPLSLSQRCRRRGGQPSHAFIWLPVYLPPKPTSPALHERCLQGLLTDPSAINISSSWQRNKGRGRRQHHPAQEECSGAGVCVSPPWRRGWRGPSAEGRAPTAGSVATPSAFCPPPAALGPASSRHRQLQTSSGGGWREASGNQVPFPHDHPRGKQRGPLSRWTCSGLLLSCTRPPARAREQPPHRGLWWSVRTQTSHSPGEPPSAPTWTWLAPRSLHHDPGPDNSLLWAGVGVDRNYTMYFIITYKGKEFEKIDTYVCNWNALLYTWN